MNPLLGALLAATLSAGAALAQTGATTSDTSTQPSWSATSGWDSWRAPSQPDRAGQLRKADLPWPPPAA